MSIWKMDLEGFPPQWLDIADRFERGDTQIVLRAGSRSAVETMRFEWYAFKRRMRMAEATRAVEDRMYPTLPRIKAEIGQLVSGGWALRFALRDVCASAQALDEALAKSPEEMEELGQGFISVRKGG